MTASKAGAHPKLTILVLGAIAIMAQQGVARADDSPPTEAPVVNTLERVEVTGSSIKRIVSEGALPVQVLTKEDIKKTGATSATDLIQMLPAMQGFVPAASSINGGGGGVTTAALHSLQSKYTLVLLDGQRMAPMLLGLSQGAGFGANLESIPLSAIERVEILTDGASALYGSDAIAGVVNFILKKNSTEGEFFADMNVPQKSGGKSSTLGITKGWGNLFTDGYNILASYSHDEQKSLAASQRSFSKAGAYLPFSYGGQRYILDQRTGNTQPANLTVNAPASLQLDPVSFNPYYNTNGNCGGPLAGISSDGTSCRFNYAATVQDIPSSVRDSLLLKGTKKIDDATTFWGEAAFTRYDMTAQFAPSAQPMGINGGADPTTSPPTPARLVALWNKYVVPYLAATGFPGTSGTIGFRSVSAGGRTDDWLTNAMHLSFGLEGEAYTWNYTAGLTLSTSDLSDVAAGGYTDYNQFAALVANGTFDPISGAGAGSLTGTLLNGVEFSKSTSRLNTLRLGAQHDLFQLDGGPSIVSLGADYSMTRYKESYGSLYLANSGFSSQPASSDYPVGGSYGQVPFDSSRNNYGLFGEWLLPFTKRLEATLSTRYDSYGKTYSRDVFQLTPDPSNQLQNKMADSYVGNAFSASTYKASLRWQPVDTLLLRGAYGTGFKAPAITDISSSVVFAGSTAGSYLCPFPGTNGCQAGTAQYDLLTGGNRASGENGLKPEKSKQTTLGFRFDPVSELSLGLDWWQVKITNQVLSAGIPEQVGFANVAQYRNLFTNPYPDPAGYATIAYAELPMNGGYAKYEGVDWDFVYRSLTPIGRLGVTWTGTYMLKQEYTTSPGGQVQTDLGVFGPDQAVVFRVQSRLAATLDTGSFSNTVAVNYKSGYQDESYPNGFGVYLQNPDGSRGAAVAFAGLQVPKYYTFDWQGKWQASKEFLLTGGIKNVFDKDPPLTLQNGGGGNQIGYDGRYADPLGRQFYLRMSYKF